MKKTLLSMLPLALVVVLSLVSFGVASARTIHPSLYSCDSSFYQAICHGGAQSDTTGHNFDGIQSNDSVRGISGGDYPGFIDLAVQINDSNTSSCKVANHNACWVMAGYGVDMTRPPLPPPTGGGCSTDSETFFWSDARTDGSWFVHCPELVGSGDYGHDVQDTIYKDGTSSYRVRITPFSSAQISQDSTSNGMQANHAFLRDELEGQSGVSAPISVWNHNEYMDPSKVWHFFSPHAFNLTIVADNPPYAGWKNGEDPSKDSTGGLLYTCAVDNQSGC